MLPIRTILCPVDFTDGSKFAFELAEAMARDYGARMVVAHVVEPPRAMGVEGVLVFQPEINWDEFRQRLAECYHADPMIQVEHVVVEGNIALEILRLAEDFRAEVIVIGTHGRSGLSRVVMGSVAEQVLRRAPCPVVTVKQAVPMANQVAAETPTRVEAPAPGAPAVHA
jgi:nucleotide-binding universal stress UspA family protein